MTTTNAWTVYQHTKGFDIIEEDGADGRDIGTARTAQHAALIAAAPDLLAALQAAYVAARNWIPTNADARACKENTIKQIDAAIAKATQP
jgi:hypothetical protein